MKKKETLLFIQMLLCFLFSSQVHAEKTSFSKSSPYPTFPKKSLNQQEGIKLEGPWKFYPRTFITPQNFKNKKFENQFIKLNSQPNKTSLKNSKFGTFVFEVNTKKNLPFFIKTNKLFKASKWFYLDGEKTVSMLKNGSVSHIPNEEIPGNKSALLKVTPLTNKVTLLVHASNHNTQTDDFKKEGASIGGMDKAFSKLILNSISLGVLLFCAFYNFILFFRKSEKLYLYFSVLSTFALFWSLIELNIIWYFIKGSTTLSMILTKTHFITFVGLNLANVYLIKKMFNESDFLKKNTKLILYFSIIVSVIYFLMPLLSISQNMNPIFYQVHFFITYSFNLFGSYKFLKKHEFAKNFTFFFITILLTAIVLIFLNNNFLNSTSGPDYPFIFILVIAQSILLLLKDIHNEKLYLKQRNQLRDFLPSLKNTLEKEMHDLNSIFKKINEVILSLDFKGFVKKETNSKLSIEIFGESPKDKSIFDTIFSKLPNNHPLLDKLKNALLNIEDIDLKQWIDLKKEFPEKVTLLLNKREKTLSIKYGELFDEQTNKITEVLLIIQDITDIEKIVENELRINRRNIIISELVPEKGRNLEKHKMNLSNFFRESRSLISDASKLASSKNVETINEWDEEFIWKNVNTVKINSKFFGLKGISTKLNEEEIKYLQSKPKKGKLTDELILEVCSSLLAIIEVISDYEVTAEEIFGLSTNTKKIKETSYIEIEKLDKMDKKIKSLSKKVNSEEMNDVLKEWGDLFKSSLLDLLKGFQSLIDLTSNELGKSVSYKVGGDDIYLKENFLSKISDSIIHLLRNSIDHAIESPKERKNSGKDQKGSIEIKCLMLESSFQLSIKDDGMGIDSDIIGEKAIESKIISQEDYKKMLESEKIELIFKEGFSSKDEANKVSGRGLGMDIIKKNIESLNGQITLNTKKGQGTEVVLTFPFESS
ncbi:MAG: hypothetical protein CME68_11850 [Halobacteriovoraceae bacterium]|nr:hypothetical protein [Halobacteriovoraceae bacterium]